MLAPPRSVSLPKQIIICMINSNQPDTPKEKRPPTGNRRSAAQEEENKGGRTTPPSPERKKQRVEMENEKGRVGPVGDNGAASSDPRVKEICNRTSTVWSKFWTVKRSDGGTFSTVSPIAINKSIVGTIGEVDSITKTGSGLLVIGVVNQKQAAKVQALVSLAGLNVTCSENFVLNSSRGVIYCRDLLNCSIEEIKEDLAEQGVIDVRQVMRRGKDNSEPTGTFFLTFRTPDPPERIKVAFYRGVRVRRYIPAPLRCFKCLRFGHVSMRCKQNIETCVCGRPIHSGTDCTPPFVCVSCGGNHSSRSNECPEFVLEKEIQRAKVMNKMTYPEARRLVRDKAYVMPAMSYAAKAAGQPKQATPSQVATPVPAVERQKPVNQPTDEAKRKKNKKKKRTPHARGEANVTPSAKEPAPAKPKQDACSPRAPNQPGCSSSPTRSTTERGSNTTPPRRSSRERPRTPRYQAPLTNEIEVEGVTDNDDAEFQDASESRKRKKGWPKGKPRIPKT